MYGAHDLFPTNIKNVTAVKTFVIPTSFYSNELFSVAY